MNLIWFNQAKYYVQLKEDSEFFKTFDWLNVELHMKNEPTCKPVVERYTILTDDEVKEIETNIREKWGDI